ncbi:ABC transporter ATP-binding protein [Cyanobium sp. BA5m-21]|uniref:ABC transporter ATP-binding protein n=1 Tax=unclassified Cyanobium TaxID=2627006 RepID=UPI0020CFBB16|nr:MULTISPECIES: ABC transporter ATP-binding protein [unclassified Cyanobium]MCP9902652.1 ABC transporter ATP-binding protein [Cyanobium sp. BA5m-10]MCP9906359.1 ABC transporter ATP-binding protein [Cyanobium sp. BA5m-21]
MTLLQLEDVGVRFGGLRALQGVDLEVKQGEIFGLLGPNGAGKTTLFNVISGLTAPSSGTVRWRGASLDGLSSHRIARLGIARTFQNLRLFSSMSCLENVLVGMHQHARQPPLAALLQTQSFRRRESQLQQQALALLDLFQLEATAHQDAASLSYGDRRRLEMARALASRPQLLLLDEPAAGMNPSEKDELRELIRRIRDQFKLTVLIIEHHVPLMLGLCDRLVVLNFGQRIALGSPDQVRRDPAVIEAYLGGGA